MTSSDKLPPVRRMSSEEMCLMETKLNTLVNNSAAASPSDMDRPDRVRMTKPSLHHIVIVGGGAAGLELATKLGDSLGRHKRACS